MNYAIFLQNGFVGLPVLAIWVIYLRLYCMSKKRFHARMRRTIEVIPASEYQSLF